MRGLRYQPFADEGCRQSKHVAIAKIQEDNSRYFIHSALNDLIRHLLQAILYILFLSVCPVIVPHVPLHQCGVKRGFGILSGSGHKSTYNTAFRYVLRIDLEEVKGLLPLCHSAIPLFPTLNFSSRVELLIFVWLDTGLPASNQRVPVAAHKVLYFPRPPFPPTGNKHN